ncbi:MAG: hypothetical protein V3U69_04935, partial [Bacteroidota bacterium]
MRRILQFFLLISTAPWMSSAQSIYGFLHRSTDQQRALEETFLQLPQPRNCETYLFALTEEPHHASSEGDWKT